ncbi:hypothetical protein BJY52DRAFT_1258253 [Lactarius psammicola]|nr:hypothetical protein BJY52DRAFT_1258253 [Lactarius psammicola]
MHKVRCPPPFCDPATYSPSAPRVAAAPRPPHHALATPSKRATTTPHAPPTLSAWATTTPHASPTPSTRATTTPHAPPTPLHAKRRGGGRCAQGGHPERGAVQHEWRTARGCTTSAVSLHACKGWRMRRRGGMGKGGAQPRERPHTNGGVCARGWCSPVFLQRREDVRAGYDATQARAMRETEGVN